MDEAPDLVMAAAETPIQRRYFAVIGGIEPRRRGVHKSASRAFDQLMI
jgi:hypothetical protein